MPNPKKLSLWRIQPNLSSGLLCLLPLAAGTVLVFTAFNAGAQRISSAVIYADARMASTGQDESLPEAPETGRLNLVVTTPAGVADPQAGVSSQSSVSSLSSRMAGPYDKYIEPGQPVPKINAHDKFVLGVKDAVSPFSFTAWVVNAGYEQLTDSSPNYGTNATAFGKRFGAGVARDVSQGVFGDSILAPLLHEDPRYYKLGPGHSLVHRVVYAGSRALITRTDSGGRSINFAQIGGNLGGAILTNAYYPKINRGFTQTAETFGGSVGGSALGFVVSEFLSGFLQAVHLQHHD